MIFLLLAFLYSLAVVNSVGGATPANTGRMFLLDASGRFSVKPEYRLAYIFRVVKCVPESYKFDILRVGCCNSAAVRCQRSLERKTRVRGPAESFQGIQDSSRYDLDMTTIEHED